MEKTYVVGIDIGGTNFRIGAVTEELKTLHFRKIPVTEVFHTPDAMGDLRQYLQDYFARLKEEGIVPDAMAIGFPATLDRDRQVVMQAPNVAFMENLPVREELSRAFQIPVYIERDVSLALLYDREKYRLQDCGILVGCYFGTGIGNAIAIEGRLLVGRNGTAGELGHIPVDGSTEHCGCGNEGCMENLAGGKYLARLCREVYPDTGIGDIFTEHGEEPLLRQFVDRIAMTVATELNILNPDAMVIGGGVPNMKDFPSEYLMERLKARARKPYPAEDLPVIFAEDMENKCVLGAALYARQMQNR